MSINREIWKSAQEMIDRYGQDALSEINIRMVELERLGETDALDVWRQIREAAEALLESQNSRSRH